MGISYQCQSSYTVVASTRTFIRKLQVLQYFMWIYCLSVNAITYRTERVKSPGLLLLGLAKKLPSTPRVSRRFSASTPVMLGWNHLAGRKQWSAPKTLYSALGLLSKIVNKNACFEIPQTAIVHGTYDTVPFNFISLCYFQRKECLTDRISTENTQIWTYNLTEH